MLMARACGQVFCRSCSQKNTTLPKFGIEKEVRVCDSCYQEHTKPTSVKTSLEKGSDFPSAYLKSSSKADDKKKEKMRPTSKASTPEMRPLQRSPEEYTKLSHYPNRSYRKTHQSNTTDTNATRRNSSVLSSASVAHQIPSKHYRY
ncbi:FYVE zinc finger [Popillia japonica]|uniref:FYVE zinc finger n=1 Tax=Popillia japonica TaxID=7064 RepID=A0AAW1JLE5_POPJA